MKRVCTVCGTANDGAARFCRNCGTPLVTGTEQQPAAPAQAANPRGRAASRQKTFVRALLGGTAVAAMGGVALWWLAQPPALAPQGHAPIAPAPAPVPAVITPPPLVKPIMLSTQEAQVPELSPAAAAYTQPKPLGEHFYRRHAAAGHASPPPAAPPAPNVATPAPAAPAPLQQPQQGDLAAQVEQCKARHSGITQIFARQRCLWRYCDGHWGQAGCPPKYGKNDNLD